MNQFPPNLDALRAMSQLAMSGNVPLAQIVSGFEKQLKALRGFDPVEAAAVFGGLLTVPELQSNCIRLEGLVHIALTYCSGTRKPKASDVTRWFAEFGKGWLGNMEDPAEDVFVSNVATPRGNFRVLEGVWEGAGFYTQRIVNTAEGMPPGGGYDELRESVYALLALSDFLCERAGLTRYQLGNDQRQRSLDAKHANSIHAFKRRLCFSRQEIEARGISFEALAPFAFDPRDRVKLVAEDLGHSSLERYPLIGDHGSLYFVLPTAVTAAIRRLVVERMITGGMRDALAAGIGREYSALFAKTPLLGGSLGMPVGFERTRSGRASAIMTKIDVGRYLSFVFILDQLDDFENTGIAGLQPGLDALAPSIEESIDHFAAQARQDPEFRDGITLVVGCGIGRASAHFLDNRERPSWRVEHIGAADLCTLSFLHRFKPLSLWRLLDARDSVEASGVEVGNANGLLNLVAWARKLDGHMVPHEILPEDFADGSIGTRLVIEQNALRSLRHEVATQWDPHVEKDVRGIWRRVQKDGDSLFKEDRSRPVYGTEEPVGRWPQAAYPTAHRTWWGEIEVPETTSGDLGFRRMKMLMVWLARAAPVLDAAFPNLPEGALLWRGHFESATEEFDHAPKVATFGEALAEVKVACDADYRTVTVNTSQRYEDAVFHQENIAERALITRTVEGFAALAKNVINENERDALVARIIPDTAAREMHAFVMHQFRDGVRESLPASPLTIDREDDAAFRFGLGWRVRSRSEGNEIIGKEACISFINALVRHVEDALCAELHRYDRRATIMLALKNHESAALERDSWSRTASAVLALRQDKDAARDTMARHESRLAGAFQASRILIEFALCECPLVGGESPGELDFSRLMARVAFIQHVGGWSDAIRWDVMEPRVRISSLGDVFVNYDFIDNVLIPFGRAGSDLRVDEAVRGYGKNLEHPGAAPKSSQGELEEPFRAAWNEQFDVTFDDTRQFIDAIERLGRERGEAVFAIPRSDLIAARYEDRPVAGADKLVGAWSLIPRAHWRDIPEGFEERDINPWRFRRRLTALRKPIVQLDETGDPIMLVAPGFVRDAFGYMLRNFYRGDFPPRQLKPLMRAWTGKTADEHGKKFTREVADRLTRLGWRTDTEVKITKLLRKGFDRDYGDVDVLAWNEEKGRVLIIECKDVQYRKSFGEIAEQLSDFRGEVGRDGKPDLLLKHLNRVALISNHLTELAAYMKLPQVIVPESHLVFRNPVPMQFAWNRMETRVRLNLFAGLDRL
ncbi:hypothetical protein [uncultured Bradyrhizobium sp.]|uniref:hypothetical protein n=1 Tax=uncultured Bradyrhizobium sp. TaxID=199684 RepID=UPI0035CAA707